MRSRVSAGFKTFSGVDQSVSEGMRGVLLLFLLIKLQSNFIMMLSSRTIQCEPSERKIKTILIEFHLNRFWGTSIVLGVFKKFQGVSTAFEGIPIGLRWFQIVSRVF